MPSLPSNFEIGTTTGDYQIASVIGRGGMGRVFKGKNCCVRDSRAARSVSADGNDNAIAIVAVPSLALRCRVRLTSLPAGRLYSKP
jgi:hypothetical protein